MRVVLYCAVPYIVLCAWVYVYMHVHVYEYGE